MPDLREVTIERRIITVSQAKVYVLSIDDSAALDVADEIPDYTLEKLPYQNVGELSDVTYTARESRKVE